MDLYVTWERGNFEVKLILKWTHPCFYSFFSMHITTIFNPHHDASGVIVYYMIVCRPSLTACPQEVALSLLATHTAEQQLAVPSHHCTLLYCTVHYHETHIPPNLRTAHLPPSLLASSLLRPLHSVSEQKQFVSYFSQDDSLEFKVVEEG